jgi:hypothetical protein
MKESTRLTLGRLADRYWYGVLALAAIGALTIRRFDASARALLFAPLAAGMILQAATMGGNRFHHAEAPLFALLGGLGAERVASLLRDLRMSTGGRTRAA